MKKSRLRILGNARGLMMLCKDVRRRWMQYGENRNISFLKGCAACAKMEDLQVDHIVPMGKRPYTFADLADYASRMFTNKCQVLCGVCNRKKGTKT